MDLPIEITSQYSKLSELCNKYKVVKLFVFGSAATGNFNSNKSDIDLIVELDEENPVRRGESLISLWSDLEGLFARKVDLLTNKKIQNPFLLKQIEQTKKIVYERKS